MIQQHQEVFPKYKKSIERVIQAIGHFKIQTNTNKIKNYCSNVLIKIF